MAINKNIELKAQSIVIYLSHRGCLHYTLLKLKSIPLSSKPIVFCHPDNTALFSDYIAIPLKTPNHLFGYLTSSLTHRQTILSHLTELLKKHKHLEFYFPAFHPYNIIFINWAHSRKLRTTITIHDFLTHAGEKSYITEHLQRRSMQLASQVVFLTHFVKNQAVKYFGPQNHYNVERHPLTPTLSTNALPHSSRPSILFIGRNARYKGLSMLLEAIEPLSIEKLTIAGISKKEISKYPSHIRSKLNIHEGYIPEPMLFELMASHHILILPYTEASQSGLITIGTSIEIAMVVTKVGGLEEQLSPEAAIWVEPNAEAIGSGINQLIEDSEVYYKVKKALSVFKKDLNASP